MYLLLLYLPVAFAIGLLGVDFGAEFVKSSLVAPNTPFEVVLTPDSQRKDASGLVIVPTDFERFYGSRGLPLSTKYPQSALYSAKSLLGLPYTDLRVALYEEMHPGVVLTNTSRNGVAFNVSDTSFSVEEVVAMQLRDIGERATSLLREKTHSKTDRLASMALSVPAHFGSLQRQALVDSATIAGIDLAGLVNDGVAAAINYATSPGAKSSQKLLVFDVGASAASATLVNVNSSSSSIDVDVLGYGSDISLSGHSLTLLLREILLAKFNVQRGKRTERTPRLLARLWREAERAKQVLSANSEVSVHMDTLADGVDFSAKITRADFEKEAEYQRSRVVVPLLQAVKYDEDLLQSVDSVLVVGGASRTPFILSQLARIFGESRISRNVNADEAVVQGTSMRGLSLARLFRTKKGINVNDCVAHNYSIAFEPETLQPSGPEDELEEVTVFAAGDHNLTASVVIPNNTKSIHLLEGRKRIARYDLPYAQRSLAQLKNDTNCLDEPEMVASFSINSLGIVKIDKIEAKCTSASASTTEMPSYTDVHSTGTDSTASSTSTASSDAPAVKRVSIKTSWEQSPLSSTDRSSSRQRLREMDVHDSNRIAVSERHHELETLAYKIRADAELEKLHEFAGDLLEFIEEGSHELKELEKKLAEARSLYAEHRGESEKVAEEQAEEVIYEPAADGVTEEDDAKKADKDVSHDEL